MLLITLIIIQTNYVLLILPLVFGSLIIFVFSFYEDLKQSLSPYFRLIILFVGSFVFIFFSEIPDINISLLKLIKDYEIIKSFIHMSIVPMKVKKLWLTDKKFKEWFYNDKSK